MTGTRTRKPAAKPAPEPAERVLTLADLFVLTCDYCPATITDPEAVVFPGDLKDRAKETGWLFDGPWVICRHCAPRWHLDAPDDVVARITAQMAVMEPGEARAMAAQALLVHDGPHREKPFTDPQPWECPRCHCLLEQPGLEHGCTPVAAAAPEARRGQPHTVDPRTDPALASLTQRYEDAGMRFPAPSNVRVTVPPAALTVYDDPGDCPERDRNEASEPEHEPALDKVPPLPKREPLSVGDWKDGSGGGTES